MKLHSFHKKMTQTDKVKCDKVTCGDVGLGRLMLMSASERGLSFSI